MERGNLKRKFDEGSSSQSTAVAAEAATTTKQVKRMWVGLQFMPTDAHLVSYYLPLMIRSEEFPEGFIHPVNIYSFHPSTLTATHSPANDLNHGQWYFFTSRQPKHAKGKRPDRTAGNGFWKATGGVQYVRDEQNRVVGQKMTLVYYECLSSGAKMSQIKTNWIMQEYLLQASEEEFQFWVMCKIYHRSHGKPSASAPQPPSSLLDDHVPHFASSSEYSTTAPTTPALGTPAEEDEFLTWISSPSPELEPHSAATDHLSSHTSSSSLLPQLPIHYSTTCSWLDQAANSDVDYGFDGGLMAEILGDLEY